jgi:hypothetical protein
MLVVNLVVDEPFFDSPGKNLGEPPEGRSLVPSSTHASIRMRLYLLGSSPRGRPMCWRHALGGAPTNRSHAFDRRMRMV